MRLVSARVQKYRSIRDTGWFELEGDKTILVGANEAGKTVLLQSTRQPISRTTNELAGER
jgi:predicted ATP-dependent endonuclease of OLD family